MFVTAVCVLFHIKLRWSKKNNFYDTSYSSFTVIVWVRIANSVCQWTVLKVWSVEGVRSVSQ